MTKYFLNNHFWILGIIFFVPLTAGFAQDSGKKSIAIPPGAAPMQVAQPQAQAQPSQAPLITTRTNETTDKIVANFFALLTRGQVDQAYDYLTTGTKIAERPGEVASLKSKTREALKAFGEIIAFEPVETKYVGTHLLCSTYVSIGKGFPLRWKFYFYNWDKTWKLIDIRVDDRLVEMFEDRSPQPPTQ